MKERSDRKELRWLPLDNAAKIYPAAQRQTWSNVFRLSATLSETVDTAALRTALDVTVPRFPSIAARLRRGVFWYYLQQLSVPPRIQEESSYPLTRMSRSETRSCALRVIVYGRRIAVEFYHSLTDGNGALIFLKSLLAEYLQQRYAIAVPPEHGVLCRREEPKPQELADDFPKYAGAVSASRKQTDAWRLPGTPENDDFQHVTCFSLPVQRVLDMARSYGVTVTEFLCAVTLMALQNLQKQTVALPRHRKHLKVQIPIDLRRLFPSQSLRNFALYTITAIDPRLGEYSFSEICKTVHHQMGLAVDRKFMSTMIATNVNMEQRLPVKLLPLFIKNICMKLVFDTVGERKSCLNLSNLGAVKLPEEMLPYVQRMDFILGVQATAPYNCGVLSYGDTLYVNFIRNIREPELEYHVHCVLRDMGLPVQVQSNQR